MEEYTYITQKYRIQQKTSDTEITTLHPETDASITLVKPFSDIDASNTQEALEKLNAKINVAECPILYGTTKHWDDQPSLISEENMMYVYTDAFKYTDKGQEIVVAGIKFGDGNAYLKDKAFVTDSVAYEVYQLKSQLQSHLEDNRRHITDEDRTKWDNKADYEVSQETETLILSRG